MLELGGFGEPRSPLAQSRDTSRGETKLLIGLFEAMEEDCTKLLLKGGGDRDDAVPSPLRRKHRQSLSRQSSNPGRWTLQDRSSRQNTSCHETDLLPTPPRTSEDTDAEERNRPENEIDSDFDSDLNSSTATVLMHLRRSLSGSTATSSTASSTSDFDGGDEDEGDSVADRDYDESGWPATPLIPDLYDSEGCHSSSSEAKHRLQKRGHPAQALQQQHLQRQRQGRGQQERQHHPPLLAPLVFQTLTLAAGALWESVGTVAGDAENYIADLYCQQHQQQQQQQHLLDPANPSSSLPSEDMTMGSAGAEKAVTALRVTAGLAACLLIWLLARTACLLGPELMFGVSFVCVVLVARPGWSAAGRLREPGQQQQGRE